MTTQTQAGSATIDQLIINSPYKEPGEHWRYHRETRFFTREQERRKAGYVRASEKSRSFDDPGTFVELPLVNKIRPRVKAWREADYPGATGITKRLLAALARLGTEGLEPAFLFLPVGSNRDIDVACRGPRLGTSRNRYSERRWPVRKIVLQRWRLARARRS